MAEIDSGLTEGVALAPAINSTEQKSSATQLKDAQKGVSKDIEAMEVDGIDTEEDDSQITSSTENGISGGGGDSKMSEDAASKPLTSIDDSQDESQDLNADEAMKSVNSNANENSNSNGYDDGISQNSSVAEKPAAEETSQDSMGSATKCDEKDDNSLGDGEQLKANSAENSDTEGETASQEASPAKVKATADTEASAKDDSVSQPESIDTTDDPLAVSERDGQDKLASQKENGVVSSSDKAQGDMNIVDLGDDSDEEDEEMEVPKADRAPQDASNGTSPPAANAGNKKAESVCSDSDGAVIIGSDSENETSTPASSNTQQKTSLPQKPNTSEVIDDDDDDCVVIEDDTPAPQATANDLSKRKSLAMESPNHSDDSQPPSKRQRNITPVALSSNAAVSQITIKDARSLMPQDSSPKKDSVGIYPVNITPAGLISATQGPPKLVPVSPNTSAVGGLPGLNTNANLLPGLTDDMFVLEAPSFIVPYIYEKPPADNLKDVVKEIESKYKLSKEDLADADKSDEFDMMTEQNKEEKDEKSGKKKKKRRNGDDADESWSEESEEDEDDEDDDDSDAGTRTKVLIKEANDDLSVLKGAIKPAAVVAQSTIDPTAGAVKPGQENYFESPLGKFFMDIGVGLVQEFVQSDLIRLQKRKMRKSLGKNIAQFERAISALSGNLDASKKKNSPFKFTMKRCEFCNFKSESALAMANHYETPHMNGVLYKCNFCSFEIRNATEIVYHMEAVHNIKARLIKPLPYHQCPNCGFEDNGKAKLARHQPVCAKKFRPEINLAPPNDWEAPAKIPRIKPRHGLVGTATAYQAMAAQAAAQKAALASIQQQQQQAAQVRNLQAAALAAQNAANKLRGRPPIPQKAGPNGGAMLRGPNLVRNPMATNVVLPNNYQNLSGGQLLQAANALAKKTLSGQPSISITPLPRQSATAQPSSPSTSKMPQAGMKPGQSPTGGNKAQFVICEICDGYIKDLEQLRNHMQWMHKVKIHPKMIYNRPPLNCQKCQFRFFTDQGLERHLLGSHGLVTSSMQEAANKGKDAGRCPVCGRMYQWKLLNHVSRDHHMTLKPAHLSYKCTVCTATFGMYKQFETHVYTAHSTVAKKAMDGKKNNTSSPSAGASSSGSMQRSGLSAANDSLLKPLKINDEITIIPQPASKSRITNMESHVID